MQKIAITGTGLFAPESVIDNEELVLAFNAYVDLTNAKNAARIERGEAVKLEHSSADFIVKASGIQSRHVVDRQGILDPEFMAPRIPERAPTEPSLQCDMAVAAARQALAQAKVDASEIDAVIVACSNMQRAYPAIAVEVQAALGTSGFAFDMNVACSSATFGLSTARDLVAQGTARRALVVSPEICTGHLNFTDRESHFIFGDACTAMVIEPLAGARAAEPFEIVSTKLATRFSNAIRNDFGFLNRAAPEHRDDADKLFVQQGRKVFKEVSPMVAELISAHLDSANIPASEVRRMWMHQANLTMNQWVTRKVLGRDASEEEAPSVLHEFANTSSAGSIIVFHKFRQGLGAGDVGVICSFGAGYSVGSVIVRRALPAQPAQPAQPS
jgi:beta-ketodecanoyl-[acyl-carrier-protein] synthase